MYEGDFPIGKKGITTQLRYILRIVVDYDDFMSSKILPIADEVTLTFLNFFIEGNDY